MITRPLDLASRLRVEPRNFDVVFLVNGGLLVLFFYLFGSQFVLAPGVGLDFQLPRIAGAQSGAVATTHHVTLSGTGLIFIDDGRAEMPQLREWLKRKAGETRHPSLLLIVNSGVPTGRVNEIWSAAGEAGFTVVQYAAEEPAAASPGGR